MITGEQRKARSKGIGGSDAAAVLGISPFKSPADVWVEKTQPLHDELGEDADVDLRLELGNVMESHIAARWSKIENKPVQLDVPTIVHPDHPWMLGNVDGLVGEKAGLEVKLVLSGAQAARLGDEGTDSGLPEHVVQCHHYMAVTNRHTWHLVYFDPRKGLRSYMVRRDPEFERLLIDTERKFWQHVEERTPPSEHMEKASKYALSRLHSIASEGMMQATPEQVAIALEYAAAHREESAAKSRKGAAWKELVKSIGPFSGFEWEGGKVTYKNAKSGPVNWQALARKLGATADDILAHKAGIGTRRMIVKINGDRDEEEGAE